MNVNDLQRLLGPPTYVAFHCGGDVSWALRGKDITPPVVCEVSRDDDSRLSRQWKYVLYTYEINGEEYVCVGMGSDELGGQSGYWPREEVYALDVGLIEA